MMSICRGKNYNDDGRSTVERCKHDKEHPYFLINRETVRDASLSLEARGLLIYLLSHKDGWVIVTKQIMSSQGIGRDKLRKIFSELIDGGYLKRETILNEKNLTRIKYFFSEIPRFRKEPREVGFQAPEVQAPENPHCKEEVYSKNKHKEEKEREKKESKQPPNPQGGVSSSPEKEKKDRSAKLAISEEAKELVDYIQQKVKASNANAISMTADKLSKDRKAADQLLKELEKERPSTQTSGAPPSLRQKLDLVKRVVDIASDHDIWKFSVTDAISLKKKWGKLSLLLLKKKEKTSPIVALQKEKKDTEKEKAVEYFKILLEKHEVLCDKIQMKGDLVLLETLIGKKEMPLDKYTVAQVKDRLKQWFGV